ncbi:hypothetical protein B0H11DRAFT_2037380 [Mycena galericulata]|nr:hypothetical protein B0H11DRAFT_2037380 [Mycena galericulata]
MTSLSVSLMVAYPPLLDSTSSRDHIQQKKISSSLIPLAMSEQTFKTSEWIAQGKKMASAPPMVHRVAKDTFTIPQAFYYHLLPSPMISITSMLDFSLPLQFTPNDAPQPCQYFSMEAPDLLDQDAVSRLHRLPIPEAKVVRKLVERSRQAWLDGYQSILYSHLILDLKQKARGPWVKASDWLAQQKKLAKKNPAHSALVEETAQILRMMPWSWAKPPGLSDSEPVYNLWRFLGPHWLTGSQQNDMLELLRRKVDNDLTLSQKFRVQGTALNSPRNPIGFLSDLTSPSLPEKFSTAIPSPNLFHLPSHLDLDRLPTGTQTDGFSCGMLVDNSHQHLIDPEIALTKSNGNFVHERLRRRFG